MYKNLQVSEVNQACPDAGGSLFLKVGYNSYIHTLFLFPLLFLCSVSVSLVLVIL